LAGCFALHMLSLQIEKEAQTWLDSDSDEEGGGKKREETRMEEAPGSVESGEPQPGTSKDTEEMVRSPAYSPGGEPEFMRADDSDIEELEGAVGGAD